MKVEINYLRWLKEELRKINEVELNTIEWTENGIPLDISEENIDDWDFVGLSNVDFVMTDGYKRDVTKSRNKNQKVK